jgi:hypothetical protein
MVGGASLRRHLLGVRVFVCATLASVALGGAGCAPEVTGPAQTALSANFEPTLVIPTVPPEAIHDYADALVTTDGEALVQFVERRVGQDNVDAENREFLRTPGATGTTTLKRIRFANAEKIAFVLRRGPEARALVVDRTEGDNLVVPIPWVALVLNVTGTNPDDLKTWQEEIARRVATAGRATGIVLFPNGNAMAVIVGVESVPGDDADTQLVALARFMKAGSYSPDTWGPKLNGGNDSVVSTRKMNGHAGVSARDILRTGGSPATPPTPGSTL